MSLPQPEYSSHVASIEVDLLVVANLILSPNDVHIMPGDTVQFRLLQVVEFWFYPTFSVHLNYII